MVGGTWYRVTGLSTRTRTGECASTGPLHVECVKLKACRKVIDQKIESRAHGVRLYKYIYIYTCIHIYMYVCIYVYVYMCIYIRVYTCTHICI